MIGPKTRTLWGGLLAALALVVMIAVAGPARADVRPPADAAVVTSPGQDITPSLPSNLKSNPAAQFWNGVGDGTVGRVTIPDAKAGRLVQTNGMDWLRFRQDVVGFWGAVAVLGMLTALSAFFMIRGRIKIDSGRSGRLIQRFTRIEVVGHWLTAISFLLLALTGLVILYGRDWLLPWMGPEVFAGVARAGKYAHNFGGFAFMAGLLMIFVMWVRHNVWDRYDFNWILKGGGLLSKGHPPADKFNFGQKTVFWMVTLVGLALSVSGLNLLMPFWFLPDIETMQVVQLIHAGLGVGLFALMLAHIYIGSVGMESAFDAMSTGYVDINWAREHHSAWVDRHVAEHGEPPPPAKTPHAAQPAE
ncbi:formate dehydrogenase subunit gamma [Novispirillum sp. DQ9]|uniref:formate dehydrogenase subunit gamma n=1 Tax=Novispirillum sp. DQ9 TaxID=3398612 RepID=UPI003C7CFDBE